MLVGKALAVIILAFQNTPESFHGTVIDAMSRTGHALGHACCFELAMKCPVRVLNAPVTMKERHGSGIFADRLGKRLKHKWVIVVLTYDEGDNAPVVKVEDGGEIYLVNGNSFISFELRDIRQPLLVGLVGVKLAIQQVFSHILRFPCPPGATVTPVFDGRFDALFSANAKDALVVHMNAVLML